MDPIAESTVNPKKLAFINGLIWAVINVAIFLITYYVKPNWIGSGFYQAFQLLLGVGLAIYFTLDIRNKVGGYWSFKEALRAIFLMFIMQALIVYAFTIIFGKIIEPDYAVKMKDIMVSNMTTMMEKIGSSQEEIDEAIAKNEETFDNSINPGPKELFIGVAGVIVMYFIGALIFAAIFKKDPPIFVNSEQ